MKLRSPCLALATLSLLGTGCEAVLIGATIAADDESEGGGEIYYEGAPSEWGNVEVESAHLEGSIGQATHFSASAKSADAMDDGEYLSITLWVDGGSGANQWAAMTAFEISGGARDQFFTQGTTLELDGTSSGIYGYGCSGAGENMDPYAYEVTITGGQLSVEASDDPDLLLVTFSVSFDGTDAVSGSFEIEARD